MSCDFYEFQSSLFGGDYYCRKDNKVINSDTYYRYCRDYGYRDCPIYLEQSSGGCFITTIVCEILGKNDDDEVLNNLRNFRDNVLQKNEKYYDLLKDYDIIGSMVADCIVNDKDKLNIALWLYNNMILPINGLVLEGNSEEAVNRYYDSTLAMVEYYGLSFCYENLKNNDYEYGCFNPKKAGHGLRKKKNGEGNR